MTQNFEFVGWLCHERENVLVIRGHGRRDVRALTSLPLQVGPADDWERPPVGMAQFVHQRYWFSLTNPGPAFESIAAEESGLSPHLPDVQAVEQGHPSGCWLVQGNYSIQPLPDPFGVTRVWRGPGYRRDNHRRGIGRSCHIRSRQGGGYGWSRTCSENFAGCWSIGRNNLSRFGTRWSG